MRLPYRPIAWIRPLAFVVVAIAIVAAWQGYRTADAWHVGFPRHLGSLLPLYANDSPIPLDTRPDQDAFSLARAQARRDALTVAVAQSVCAFLGVAFCVARRYSTFSCLLVALVGVWTTNVAVGHLRFDHRGFVEPFSRRGLEYHTDVPAVDDDPLAFIKGYPDLARNREISHHAGTHPPGGVLFLWAGEKLLVPPAAAPGPARVLTPRQLMLRRLMRMNANSDPPADRTLDASVWLAVTFTALGVLPAFWLARSAGGAAAARRMLPLYVASPSLILFGATSMDGVFLVFNLFALAAGVAAVRRPSFVLPIVAGVALWAAAFMTYAAIAVPTLLVCLTIADALRWIRFRRPARGFELQPGQNVSEDAWRAIAIRAAQPRPRPVRDVALAVTRCAAVGVVFVLCQLLAQRTIGYDLRACAESAMRIDFSGLRITGYESRELWACISIGNAFALAIGSGVSASALVIVALLTRAWRPFRFPVIRFGLATIATIALLAMSTLFTLETERVWLCLTPAILIAATAAYRGGFIWLLAPLGMIAQAIWVEVYFRTWW